MKVYTYHVDIPFHTERELIALWARSWRRMGWEPVVLDQGTAEAHLFFSEYFAAVSRFPTTNSPAYERACFLRWLAIARVGGGLMTDYDVINYGWTPEMCPRPTGLITLERWIPCAVLGRASDYLDMCLRFAAFRPNASQRHVSDMEILLWNRDWTQEIRTCREYRKPGWETAKLVHFGTSTLPRPKTKRIQEIRPV